MKVVGRHLYPFVFILAFVEAVWQQTHLLLADGDVVLKRSSESGGYVQHAPVKLGQVLQPQHDWESAIYFYGSVVSVSPSEVRIYYTCGGLQAPNTTFLAVAVSHDGGATFTKPSLGLISYGGSTDNNLVFALPFDGWPNTVFIDQSQDVPMAQRYKMTFDQDKAPHAGRYVYVAGSPDGFRWTILDNNTPNTGPGFGDTMTCAYNNAQGGYTIFGRIDSGGSHGSACPGNYATFRNIARAASVNASATSLGNFSRPEIVFSWDDEDPLCYDLYNAAALPAGTGQLLIFPSGTLHLCNSTNSPFTRTYGKNDNILDVRLAHSIDDGRSFHYVSREPFIPRGMGLRDEASGMYNTSGSEWDSGFVFMATGMIPAAAAPGYVDMFYFGTQMTHRMAAYTSNMLVPGVAKGYGRLRLRQEGYVSLAPYQFTQSGSLFIQTRAMPVAPECLGEGVTSPIRLRLNVDTGVAGHINVTLLDADTGGSLPSFAGDHVLPVVANHIRVPVQFWVDPKQDRLTDDLRPALSRNGSLTFSMVIAAAHLYSLQLSC